MDAKLEAEDLTRIVDGVRIVDAVSFGVADGEVLAILGSSGAGKSSLLRLLNRLDEPTEGTVFLDGEDYRTLPPRELRRAVGYVPQRPALRDGTVFENVTVGPRLRDEPFADDAVEDLLKRMDLGGYAERNVEDLSGGETQRVAVARTVFNDPEVLLLDEPTASLDSASESRVETLLEELIAETGLATVLVTHDTSQARRLADRVALLEDGGLTSVGRVSEVLA
ncbi:ABC transporter ATP-binding protein [Haladaptatus salinisoli]|uniref:ABC transporter ATP-binding protein n=1 Tax=Haladaptatus salinisoli TaxID=2884876 RepID=UPI001D0AD642|nr:ATP-binding cassette domain-containing protein [Haladaptatus salinisoli]